MGKKYVIYQRVSTDEQARFGYSLEAMLEKCQHYIASQEDAVLVEVYEDRGYSGTLGPNKRPALNRLLEDASAKSDAFDAVLVWKLDRLSRSLRDTLNVEHLLRKANKGLESVTERGVDTSSASGRMFFNTIASFAEFESGQIADRTRNAMSSKVGQIHLGGKAPLGYKLVGDKFKVDPRTSDVIKIIFARFIALRNYSKVAEGLNKKGLLTSCNAAWSHKKIHRVLSNPVYTGASVWGRRRRRMWRNNPHNNWILKSGTHEPIVSQKVFEKAQNIIATGRTGPRGSKGGGA